MNRQQTNDLTTPITDRISKARLADNEIGALLGDLTDYILREDYKRAVQVSGHLFIAVARRAGIKPFTALRGVYKS